MRSYQIFRPSQIVQIPYLVKEQILSDCCRLGSEAGRSDSSGHAAFHASLAFLLGFGTTTDVSQALGWASKSASKGIKCASTLQELIMETFVKDTTSDTSSSQERYSRIIREGFRRMDVPYLDAVPSTPKITDKELRRVAFDYRNEDDISTPFCFSHYAVLHGLTSNLGPEDDINLQHPSNGETALALASKIGDIQAVYNLVNCGADPLIESYDGCLPIHFLSMFQPEVMKLASFLLLLGPRSIPATVPNPPKEYSGGKGLSDWQAKMGLSYTWAIVWTSYTKLEFYEVNINVGEYVAILSTNDTGWSDGINSKGESGRFPRAFVKQLNSERQFRKPAGARFSEGSWVRALVISDIERSNASQLEIRKGEVIFALNFFDDYGMGYGFSADSTSGVFPRSHVYLDFDQTEGQTLSATPSCLSQDENLGEQQTQIPSHWSDNLLHLMPEEPSQSADNGTIKTRSALSQMSGFQLAPSLSQSIIQETDSQKYGSQSLSSQALQLDVDEWFYDAVGCMGELLNKTANDLRYLDPQLPLQ